MLRRLSRIVSVFLAGALFVAGCGDGPNTSITVFAATSLTGAFTEIGKGFETAHPRTKVTFNFAASSALVEQVSEGARVDVLALADRSFLKRRADVFAHNRLVLITKPGSSIHSLRDLAIGGVISLCADEAPCGKYAKQALTAAGVVVPAGRVTRSQNVAATMAAVTDGDAVAGIVYATDARAAGRRVATIAIEPPVVADYPIAALRRTPSARAFAAYVRDAPGQKVLARFGFLPA